MIISRMHFSKRGRSCGLRMEPSSNGGRNPCGTRELTLVSERNLQWQADREPIRDTT